MERALLALCALCLNALLGGPRPFYIELGITAFLYRPHAWLHKLVRKLNRDHRSQEERRKRGIVLSATTALCGLLFGVIVGGLFHGDAHFAELLILSLVIPVRPSWDVAAQVRRALQSNEINSGRAAFQFTPMKHYLLLDEAGMARAAIELLAVNAAQKIIGPIMWYMLLGLPGLFLCVFMAALFEATTGDDAFSKPIQSIHEIVQYVPARLSMFLWLLAALFLPSLRFGSIYSQTLTAMKSAENSQAVSLFAAASVLGLSLGGPSSAYYKQWVGNGTPKPKAQDIKRAQYLFALFCLLLLLALGLFL